MGSDACQHRGFWGRLFEAIVLLEVHGNVPAHSRRTVELFGPAGSAARARGGSRSRHAYPKAASLAEHLPFTDRNGRRDDVALPRMRPVPFMQPRQPTGLGKVDGGRISATGLPNRG